MPTSDLDLIVKKSSKFSKYLSTLTFEENENSIYTNDISFGGIIRKGQLGWRAKGSYFEVSSLKTGQKLSDCCFDSYLGCRNCIITCVCEIGVKMLKESLLTIGIQYGDNSGSIIAIFSIHESKILRCIELNEKVTTCHFIKSDISKRTILNIMDECLAIGTDAGKIILLDLNWQKCQNDFLKVRGDTIDCITFVRCHLVKYDLGLHKIRQTYCNCKQEKNSNFGILLETLENTGFVLCLNSIIQNLSLVSGFEDGRLIIYDLCDLRLYHITLPESKSPLVKLAFMEPPDDPRPCIYIWAFHENSKESVAIMHSLMYEKRLIDVDGICLYENFQSSSVCLILPTFEKNSLPVVCQAIIKSPSNDDEEITSICLLSWKTDVHTVVLIFDINQWYKEEMPQDDDWRRNPSYLASFKLKYSNPLDIYIDSNTVAPFNSIQRPEEHFYPIAISFDCTLLQNDGSYNLHWPGLQNRAIQLLHSGGPIAILEPSAFFEEMIKASLLPQFCELNYNSTFSLNMQREILLSIAIEYNCTHLLWECSKCWSDGSHLGKNVAEGLTLSTMTEWIWKRASNIKNRCNSLCKSLFDYSGSSLDRREKKELFHLSRQLKLLADLLNSILKKWNDNIPKIVFEKLENQHKSLKSASEYQDVLVWLLNIGLLPESVDNSSQNHLNLVPYPYNKLKNLYESQRANFAKLNDNFVSLRTKSCRILFIDSFIEHECNAAVLRDDWLESGGNGLYPPPSLQAMLRTILIPDVSFQNKCALFLYFFLDLNMTVKDERHREIVENLIKFPTVFKLTAPLIKTVQAFWSLDHGNFQIAIDEIISPFNVIQKLSQWQKELLFETLLAQNQSRYALRILHALNSWISPVLELKTLLANNLISEAFNFARKENNIDILSLFFTGCLCMGKYNVFRELPLTEKEGEIVIDLLKNHRSMFAQNLHIIYLLEKSKYIEAISYLEELAKKRCNKGQNDVDTPTLILSAYNTTMTPLTKTLIDTYYKLQKRLKDKEVHVENPYPLSCQLIKRNATNLLGGVYESAALGTHFATYYWDNKKPNVNRLKDAVNAPFIRKPQLEMFDECSHRENISYPDEFKIVEKRRVYDEFDSSENPLKKRKIGPSTLSLLLPQNETGTAVNSSRLTKIKLRTIEADISEKQTKPFCGVTNNTANENISVKLSYSLNTPIVKNILDSGHNVQNPLGQPNKTLNIHSILKGKSNSQSNSEDEENVNNFGSSQSFIQDESGDEEKSIRFQLPKTKDDEKELVDMSFAGQETLNILPFSERPSKRKSLHYIDGVNSSTTTFDSPELYYSPETSIYNSIYIDAVESTITETETKAEEDNEPKKQNVSQYFMGAQPRKPLRSVTRSRSISSEKLNSNSYTPEPNDNTLNSSQKIEWEPNTPLILNQSCGTIKEPTLFEENKSLQNANDLNTIPYKNNDLTKINTSNFKPFMSSSKVEHCESKFVDEKTSKINKVLEKSTVIGGVTFMESTTTMKETNFNNPADLNKDEQIIINDQEMDTTIDMTGSDVTAFGSPEQLFSDSSYLNVNAQDTKYIVPNVFGEETECENKMIYGNESMSNSIEDSDNIEEAKNILLNELNPTEAFPAFDEFDLEIIEDSTFSENNISKTSSDQNNSESVVEVDDGKVAETYNEREIFNVESNSSNDSAEAIEENMNKTECLNSEIICLTSSSSDSSGSTNRFANKSEDGKTEDESRETIEDDSITSASETSSESKYEQEAESQLLYEDLDVDEQQNSNQSKNEVFDFHLQTENTGATSTTVTEACDTIVEIIEDTILLPQVSSVKNSDRSIITETITPFETKNLVKDSSKLPGGLRSVSEPPADDSPVELGTPSKILTRRQSNMLSKIEESEILDSPSSRTRLRTRLNSNDSLTSTPTRTRYTLAQQKVGTDDPHSTPTKTKLKRSTSMLDISTKVIRTTPRTTRAQSMTVEIKSPAIINKSKSHVIADPNKFSPLSIDLRYTSTPEITVLLSSVPTPKKTRSRSKTVDHNPFGTPKKRIMRRRLSTTKELSTASNQLNSHKEDVSETSHSDILKARITPIQEEVDYSSSRRLTRTQLKIMKKSAQYASGSDTLLAREKPIQKSSSPPISEDSESTSSKVSHRSNISANRRVTRSSSTSNMDQNKDDIASQTSGNKSKRKEVTKSIDDWTTQPPETVLLEIAEKYSQCSSDNESGTSSMASGPKKASKRGRNRKI